MLPKLKEEYTKLKATEVKPVTVDIKRMHSTDGVVVEGIDNCPIKFAKCCSPLPGDEIIGFVTRGFGVSIHKKDCANVRESMRQGENADRWVNAYWADDAKENYKATLDLLCMDRANLLSDVALALGDMRVPIYSLTARSAEQGRARMSVTVGITNTESPGPSAPGLASCWACAIPTTSPSCPNWPRNARICAFLRTRMAS